MAVKIFPRYDLFSYPHLEINGAGGNWNPDTAPLSNILNKDLSRVGRMTGLWWPRFYWSTDQDIPTGGGLVTFANMEGLAILGLNATSTTEVRVRWGASPSAWTEILGPTSVTASTRVTASASAMADAPDDFQSSWPTYTGTGGQDTSVRVAIANPSGSPNDANMPHVEGHRVLVLAGRSDSAAAVGGTVKLYDGTTLVKTLGTLVITTNISDGGDLFEYQLVDADVADWNDVEIQVEITASGSTYGMCGAVALAVDTDDADYDSGWITLMPSGVESFAAGWTAANAPSLQTTFYHLFPSTWTAGTKEMRVDFFDSAWLNDIDSTDGLSTTESWSVLDVGAALLGQAESAAGWALDSTSFGVNDASERERGLGGQQFALERYRARSQRYGLHMLDDSWRRTWLTHYDGNKGGVRPLAVVPDSSGSQATWWHDAIVGYQSQIQPFSLFTMNSSGTYWRKLLEIEELVSD